jgi:lantibiotic transport system ATP-binding protein
MHCLETRSLTFGYSQQEPVLKSIDMKVEQGTIYGFLGPNGAGKTTTLRLLLGLLKNQQGEISVFGKDLSKHRVDVLKNIGSLIESPSLYGHLTAYENLLLLSKTYRCSRQNITDALAMVQLTHTENKKVSQFSLGMKQRMSIAVALLHKPPLLILDEPTNGLDPNGIIDMRELLKRLNRETGTTIIISSHLLSEIEKLVTHVGIIHRGRMRFQGTLADLNSASAQDHKEVTIETDNGSRAFEILSPLGFQCTMTEDRISVTNIERTDIPLINSRLVAENINVYGITTQVNDLENIFMNMINN